jgi:hypothetical protein
MVTTEKNMFYGTENEITTVIITVMQEIFKVIMVASSWGSEQN